MSRIIKLIDRLYSRPIPNDITHDEIIRLARHYGCIVRNGGNHQIQIVYPDLGVVIPIPVHGKTIKEAYIKQIKDLFDKIREGK